MKEIVCVKLENDMDLILAHKRAMKLCELMGFSLIVQTSIATAVSEIARCAIEFGKNAELRLGIDGQNGKKVLKAVIQDNRDFAGKCLEATQYAKRLVDDIEVIKGSKQIQIILKHRLALANLVTDQKVESFVDYFKREPPLSPYDELRRKNILLHQLAEKIQESENDFRLLTDSLPLMMFSVNPNGAITYSNKWLQGFFGTTPKELTSKSWKEFIYEQDYNLFSKDLNNAVIKQIALTGQYRFKEQASGNYLWHMVSVIPLKNEKGVITRWIGFIVDINAQKQIEQTLKDNRVLKETQDLLFENQDELQRKVVELNRSNYELEQFAHMASHDLQEPLRKLFFYADVLNQKYSAKIDGAGKSMLISMTNAAGRMKELITDLLSYSQLHNQDLTFEPVDLNLIIQEVYKDLDVTIKEKDATIKTDSLPLIEGNPIRLRQMFMNLVSNGLKYSKKDIPPNIEVRVTKRGSHVVITVKDNGIGFEDEYKEKIFGLFQRLHTRDQFPGTGIGLSICKRIAELHYGAISADSKVGEFSIFEVTLPVTQEQRIAAS